MKTKILFSLNFFIFMLFIILLLSPQKVEAATFVVNNIDDSSDANPGDGICADTKGHCTLRTAIEETNALFGADEINFNISGTGPHIIMPTSSLPDLTDEIIIDGCTEPDADCESIPLRLNVEIDGNLMIGGSGISFDHVDNSVVRGLSITNFQGSGIEFTYTTNSSIQSCFIGRDATGTTTKPNFKGIVITTLSKNNTVGGLYPQQGNIISGNTDLGIDFSEGSRGDYDNTTSYNYVYGNYIGTDYNFEDLGNGFHGIETCTARTMNGYPSHHIYIGGITAGQKNYIMYNIGNGINLNTNSSHSVRVLRNSIAFNDGLGVDFLNDGVTSNDNGDADFGPNLTINFPTLFQAIRYRESIYISGELDTIDSITNGGNYLIEFFGNSEIDPSGNGEGEMYLCSTEINVATTGDPEEIDFTCATDLNYDYITSLNTDISGDPSLHKDNTSEFSNAIGYSTAKLGLSQNVTSYKENNDSFDITLNFNVTNTGDLDVENLQLEFDLSKIFPAPATY